MTHVHAVYELGRESPADRLTPAELYSPMLVGAVSSRGQLSSSRFAAVPINIDGCWFHVWRHKSRVSLDGAIVQTVGGAG